MTRPFPQPLRTARLNRVGCSALVAATCVAGAAAHLIGELSGLGAGPAVTVTVAGLLALPTTVLVLDRRRWSAMSTSWSWTDDAAEVVAVADRLRADGIEVTVSGLTTAELRRGPRPSLVFRQRDSRRVRAALVELGLAGPSPHL